MSKPIADKIRKYRIQFQTEHWPAVAQAHRWDVRDEERRRELRAQCWQEIGIPEKGNDMPITDAEATALFTLCRHLADPDNITKSLRWDQCKANFEAFNKSRQGDHWEVRGHGPNGSRRLQNQRFGGRRTAQGDPLDDPLSLKEANQRLWKMRATTRRREAKGRDATPSGSTGRDRSPQRSVESIDPDLIPF